MNDISYPLVPSLEDVRKLFETWRATRQYKCPIPDQLWQAAAALTPSYPLSKISTTLRLNYADLKKRVTSSPCFEETNGEDELSFVELPFGVREKQSTDNRPLYSCRLEMEKPSGERMSCIFYESVPDELESLVKAFIHHKP